MDVKYNFSKLDGRIIEKFGTFAKFAQAMGMSSSTLSQKRKNQAYFTMLDIEKSLPLLDIKRSEIPDYYFVPAKENNGFDESKIEGLQKLRDAITSSIIYANSENSKSENDKNFVNPIAVMEKFPQAASYWCLEMEAQNAFNAFAKEYLEKFQDDPDNWKNIIEEYKKKGGFSL